MRKKEQMVSDGSHKEVVHELLDRILKNRTMDLLVLCVTSFFVRKVVLEFKLCFS